MYTTTILAPCNQISLFIFVFYDDDDDTYLFTRYPCLIFIYYDDYIYPAWGLPNFASIFSLFFGGSCLTFH